MSLGGAKNKNPEGYFEWLFSLKIKDTTECEGLIVELKFVRETVLILSSPEDIAHS